MKLANKIALLTGAGSGIGRCLAAELAKQGARLILTDINRSGLEETIRLYDLEQSVLGCVVSNFLDINDVERTAIEALQFAKQASSKIDILYNNAGIMAMGPVKNLHWEDFERMQCVNLNAPMKLTHLLLPHMIENGGGYIAFTCSASAVTTPPGAAGYGMTKAGIAAFAEALRAEVYRENISVTTICPGFVHTQMTKNIDFRDKKCEEQATNVPKYVGTSPERVAQLSVSAMIKRKGLVVIGFDERIKRFLKQLCMPLYEKLNLLMAKHLLD